MNCVAVFDIIRDELFYRDELMQNEEMRSVHPLVLGEILTAIKYNLDAAEECWYVGEDPYTSTCSYLRKIAALCVRAGMQYDMRTRDQERE